MTKSIYSQSDQLAHTIYPRSRSGPGVRPARHVNDNPMQANDTFPTASILSTMTQFLSISYRGGRSKA